jgi:hypothetical protein
MYFSVAMYSEVHFSTSDIVHNTLNMCDVVQVRHIIL